MSRLKKHQDEPVGQDSFLDVVSNLVGILIILVMVVGARAKDAMLIAATTAIAEASGGEPQVPSINVGDVADAKAAEHNVESDIHRISGNMRQQELEINFRQSERDRAQLLVVAAEQAISEHRGQLDEAQRREFDRRNELASAQSELESLRSGAAFLDAEKPTMGVIEHLPTPMAKTVFGKEIHVRLQGGKVVYVPWEEFIQLLKDDAAKKAWHLKEQDEFSDMIGPVSGFWMRYTLRREMHMVPTKVGVAAQQSVALDRFTLHAEDEAMGEPLDVALQAGSRFSSLLANFRPESTTVTAWVYPDSFGGFRHLKRELYRRGFVTAARPLPADHPIGGSPDGTRSSAQ